MVVAVIVWGRVKPVAALQFGHLRHEEQVIGMLAAAGVFPSDDEFIDLQGAI